MSRMESKPDLWYSINFKDPLLSRERLMSDFVHLSVHSDFSLKDSTIKVKDLIDDVHEKGMEAVAVTDTTNLFGAIKLYSKGKSKKVKPIVGADIQVLHPVHGLARITVLCKNTEGYKNLIQMISDGYAKPRQGEDAEPVIGFEELERFSTGMIALSGAARGHVGSLLLQESHAQAEACLREYSRVFDSEFYLELQRVGHPDDDRHVLAAVNLAATTGTPVVATNPARFLSVDDHDSHEVRRAIAMKTSAELLSEASQKDSSILCTTEQFIKTPEEMKEIFRDIPSAIENTVKIAQKCSVDIELGKNYLPMFPVPEGMTEADFLEAEARRGLNERLEFLFGGTDKNIDEIRKEYDERLDYELGIINKMGFPGYFLIVADFIQWSKDNDIAVGPGRGSGAGSLVAYSLNITDLDPLHYDLLFERFLNPERVSMPDFDIDFCMDNRDRVIDYVARKYGRKAVSQIITFGTMAAKMVVRDVARALGKPYAVGDRISRMIPNEPGIRLNQVMETQLEFQTLYDNDIEAREIIDHAMKLEGMVRQTGKHAGGVLIAPSLLTEFTPTYAEADGASGFVSQFDKDDVEQAGLVKFDFLGLRTLTIIQDAMKLINDRLTREGKEKFDILGIDLSDPKTYELIKGEMTTAVFQLESRGMKNLIHRLQPDNIEEIIALVALFRPGPLQAGMVDDFVNRKHGLAEVDYPHPKLEGILSNTYGVFVYQEQVMQTAQELAGYSLGQADMLRRAMGKKKPEEMEKQREIFTSGCVANGINKDQATGIFNLMEKFAGYGFNKSHSAAYGLIAYQTAWLKAHYPAEFMAAVLSSDMSNTEKVVPMINECRDMGIEILPPDINKSAREFLPTDDGKILYGIEAIKGIGENAVKDLVRVREEKGEFDGLYDLCAKANPHKRVMEAAIRSGLLDGFGVSRACLMANWEKARETGRQAKKEAESGNMDLFGSVLQEDAVLRSGNISEWSIEERLTGERKTLGLFLTGHPMDEYQAEIKNIATGRLIDYVQNQVEEGVDKELDNDFGLDNNNREVKVACVITDLDIRVGKKGHTVYMTLDDGTAQIPAMVFNKRYSDIQPFLEIDKSVIVDGIVSRNRKTGQNRLVVNNMQSVEFSRNEKLVEVVLDLRNSEVMRDAGPQIESMLSCSEIGKTRISAVINRGGSEVEVPIFKRDVFVTNDIIRNMKSLVGDDALTMRYANDEALAAADADMKKALAAEGDKTRKDRHKDIAKLFNELTMALN